MPKITILELPQIPVKFFDDYTVLTIPPGEIVKVKEQSEVNQGDILIRTTSKVHPFVNLETGGLWGDSLDGYYFEIVDLNKVEVKISK